MTVNGGPSADERRQKNLQSAKKMGYQLSQIMTNKQDPLLTPPIIKINFGLESLQYAWTRLESIGFVFGDKVPDLLHNGNSFFSGISLTLPNVILFKLIHFHTISFSQQLLTKLHSMVVKQGFLPPTKSCGTTFAWLSYTCQKCITNLMTTVRLELKYTTIKCPK